MIEEEKVNIGTEEHPYYMPKNNPFPIERLKQRKKRLEKWAEGYLGSEEGKKLQKDFEKESLNFMLYGKTPYFGDKDFFKDLKDYIVKDTELNTEEILKRFTNTE
jgi:hypothetical protein